MTGYEFGDHAKQPVHTSKCKFSGIENEVVHDDAPEWRLVVRYNESAKITPAHVLAAFREKEREEGPFEVFFWHDPIGGVPIPGACGKAQAVTLEKAVRLALDRRLPSEADFEYYRIDKNDPRLDAPSAEDFIAF